MRRKVKARKRPAVVEPPSDAPVARKGGSAATKTAKKTFVKVPEPVDNPLHDFTGDIIDK